MNQISVTVKDSTSIVAFDYTGNGHVQRWDRFLTIEGKRAYYIGNVCGTCSFLFERLEGANQSISPKQISERFKNGLKEVDLELLSDIKLILPDGDYIATLLKVEPKRVSLGSERDYFFNDQIQTWGIDGFWGLPHYPKIEYYRGRTENLETAQRLFEFIVPMFPSSWLKKEEVAAYAQMIKSAETPTALAISILDIKAPAVYDEQASVTEHWCLAHYLLDGHHKIFAASETETPITLLSLLSLNDSIASEEQINNLISRL